MFRLTRIEELGPWERPPPSETDLAGLRAGDHVTVEITRSDPYSDPISERVFVRLNRIEGSRLYGKTVQPAELILVRRGQDVKFRRHHILEIQKAESAYDTALPATLTNIRQARLAVRTVLTLTEPDSAVETDEELDESLLQLTRKLDAIRAWSASSSPPLISLAATLFFISVSRFINNNQGQWNQDLIIQLALVLEEVELLVDYLDSRLIRYQHDPRYANQFHRLAARIEAGEDVK